MVKGADLSQWEFHLPLNKSSHGQKCAGSGKKNESL